MGLYYYLPKKGRFWNILNSTIFHGFDAFVYVATEKKKYYESFKIGVKHLDI